MIRDGGSEQPLRKRRLAEDTSQQNDSREGAGSNGVSSQSNNRFHRVAPSSSSSLLTLDLANAAPLNRRQQERSTTSSPNATIESFSSQPMMMPVFSTDSVALNHDTGISSRMNYATSHNDAGAEPSSSFSAYTVNGSVTPSSSSSSALVPTALLVGSSGLVPSTQLRSTNIRGVFREIGTAGAPLRETSLNFSQQGIGNLVPSAFALTFAVLASGRGGSSSGSSSGSRTGNSSLLVNRNSGAMINGNNNNSYNIGRKSPATNLRSRICASSDENSSSSFDYDAINLMAIAPYGTLPQNIANRRLLAEMKQLEDSPLAACQASPREENIYQWTAVIDGPADTVYEGGTFFVELTFNLHYPFVAPKVVFLTRIYHCNINSQGKVCMDPISSGWNSCMTISTVLQSLISLMYACNPKDALVPSIAEQFIKHPDEYEKMARIWTQRYAQ